MNQLNGKIALQDQVSCILSISGPSERAGNNNGSIEAIDQSLSLVQLLLNALTESLVAGFTQLRLQVVECHFVAWNIVEYAHHPVAGRQDET